MSKNNKEVRDFLDNIHDSKFKSFVSSEKTIVEDKKRGFRLDHQGLNHDGSDRLFIQPIPGGKSKASKTSTKSVLAQVHVTDPADPQKVRDALFQSYKNEAKLIKVA